MEVFTPAEKGPTVKYIGRLKAESNWAELGVEQRIGQIGKFLMNNRPERIALLRLGGDQIECGRGKG
eukprot:8536580-Heterocapsa_arctica.AAC.1